ncbi:MAG: DUF167 domain-containing protein [Chloroflexota bacterium]|nr:DUF167 domain-containing protein [Chloroflexota bacterium]
MPERLIVPVRVVPRSRSERIDVARAVRLVLRVSAAPEGGEANRAAQALLASALGVGVAEVQLERGRTSRDKTLSIPARAQAVLETLMK